MTRWTAIKIALLLPAAALVQSPASVQGAPANSPDCIASPLRQSSGSNGAKRFGDPCAGRPSSRALPRPNAPTTPPPLSESYAGWPDSFYFGDIHSAYNRALSERRLLVVIFTAKWCNYCWAMRTEAFNDLRVRAILSTSVVILLDPERDDEYSNTKQLMNRLDIKELPAFALLRVHGLQPAVIGRIIGYHSRDQFYDAMRQIYPKDILAGLGLDPGPSTRTDSPTPPIAAAPGAPSPPASTNQNVDNYLRGH